MIPKDYFSNDSARYAAFRPEYPDSLFDAVSRLPARRRLALDCGTGNGQAAIGLATRFDRVIATDGSAEQLKHATRAENVDYVHAPAEESGLADQSVDLITAAQALHWFEINAFFVEATRVLHPDGAIAVWGYGDPTVEEPAIQSIVHGFNRGTLESYWLPERMLLLEGYRTIPFPFAEIELPTFVLEQRWRLDQLTGLMRTWSATARFAEKNGSDPVIEVESALRALWGPPDTRRLVQWPLHIRAGRLPR